MLVRPVGRGEQGYCYIVLRQHILKNEKGKSLHFAFICNGRVTLKSVTFYELAGEGAKKELETLARTLQKSGVATELLESAPQPGLFLLVCRETEDISAEDISADLPTGTKVWQFRPVDLD